MENPFEDLFGNIFDNPNFKHPEPEIKPKNVIDVGNNKVKNSMELLKQALQQKDEMK